jgi:hypothetical protein
MPIWLYPSRQAQMLFFLCIQGTATFIQLYMGSLDKSSLSNDRILKCEEFRECKFSKSCNLTPHCSLAKLSQSQQLRLRKLSHRHHPHFHASWTLSRQLVT